MDNICYGDGAFVEKSAGAFLRSLGFYTLRTGLDFSVVRRKLGEEMTLDKFEGFRALAKRLDQLMNLDIVCRGAIEPLYEPAARRLEGPMVWEAAKNLVQRVMPGDAVFIATGWVDQPLVDPGHGETDGPPGAVTLARALRMTCKARPIILTDACLVEGMARLARAAGLQRVEPAHLQYSIEMNKLLTVSILPFPEEWGEAQKEANRLFAELSPAACIAIERGGMNEQGIIHNMAGKDTSATQAKLDAIFRQAREAGVLTMGIGDGGNEIGMANIADCIRASIPFGEKCACGCGGGIAPATPVDILMTATISNWGAYGLAAMLGAMTNMPEALPDPEREQRILKATISAGFHDAIYGEICGSVDGSAMPVQLAVAQLMEEAVLQHIKRNQ